MRTVSVALLSIFLLLPSLLSAGIGGAFPQQYFLGEGRRGRVTYLVYPDGSVLIQASFIAPVGNTSAWVGEAETSIYPTGEMSLSINLTGAPFSGENHPLNATDFELEGRLLGGKLFFSGNGSSGMMIFPVEWETFSPFSLSTVILSMDLRNSSVEGSMLVPTGLAQSDLEVDFSGNRTALTFHGMVNMPYGIFVYGGETYNITYDYLKDYLKAALYYSLQGLAGRDEGSLYDLTHGALEAVDFNYILEDKSTYASIDFEIETLGDLLRAAEWLLLGEEDEGLHRLLNATYASMEETHLDMTYMGDLNRTYFSISSALDAERLAELPALLPSGLGKPLSLLTENLMRSAEALNISLSCLRGTLEARAEGVLSGGFEAVANNLKIDLAEAVLGGLSSQERSFLEDMWLGTPTLKINLCFNEKEVQMGFEGLSLRSAGNKWTNDSFMISGILNFTDSLFLPKSGEALTIVVSGMYNSTHLVTPIIPMSVPQPDESPSANTMVWWNCAASSLSPLLFRVDRDTESPRAYAGGDSVAVQDMEVVFNASGSKDNLEISAYLWDFGDGENASGMVVHHRYREGGNYTVVLTVKDVVGNIGVDRVKVMVLRDSDRDGVPDVEDSDDDNDGWPDQWDLWGTDPLLPNLLVPPLTLVLVLLVVGGASKRKSFGSPKRYKG